MIVTVQHVGEWCQANFFRLFYIVSCMCTYTVCTYFNACVYLATYFQFSSLRFDWKLTSEIKANEFSECLPRRVDRGSIIGLTCVVMNVLLYGSPLSVMCMVIQTRSVKSLDGCCFLWLVG